MRSRAAVLGGTAILLLSLAAGAASAPSHTSQIDLSHARGVQSEPSIAVDPGSPRLLVAASQDSGICGIRIYASADGGRKWSSTPLPVSDPVAARAAAAEFCAVNEWVAAGRDGWQYAAFLERTAVGWQLASSARQYPQHWSAPSPVDPQETSPDKPVVAVDDSASSPHTGRVYVAWTRWTSFGVAGRVELAYSGDHGRTWSAPTAVGPASGANWGVQLAVARDGTLYASGWNAAAPGDLWIARSTDGGAGFQPAQVFARRVGFAGGPDVFVPAEPTQPVQLDPALAVDSSTGSWSGAVYAAYPARTAHGRRIVVDALGPDLATRMRTTIAARRTRQTYDELDPTIAVDESDGTVWACFYLTGVARERTRAAFSCVDSRTGGRTWSRVVGGASAPSDESRPGALNRPGFVDNDYGPYEGLAVSAGVAHPVWTDSRRLKSLREEIYTTRIDG